VVSEPKAEKPKASASTIVGNPMRSSQAQLTTTSSSSLMRLNTTVATKTVISAFMLKKGGSRTNWLRRWFVLNGSELTYYDEDRKTKKGSLSLLTASDVRASMAPTADGAEIEIVTADRLWRIRAESEEDMHTWLRVRLL
jgi:hypothetical protein